ncbi:MAG: type II toxin-antitoxin system RelE/ParE family toxin [Rhodomicrobium sp.]|nr:type II toxin-antitoxin system RelE/ParE family toxin [Rhodomicrobium sp.]
MTKPAKPLKKVGARFYQAPGGREPARDFLKGLDDDDRKIIGEDIATLEYGWPLGMPLCRPMGDGLFEVRSSLPGGRIARVLFCTRKGALVLLHGFLKKTARTPADDLALARKRMKELK